MSQFIKFYFTSSILDMFRTLIYPSTGACDFSIVSPHWLSVLVSMCVEVSVWLGLGGICAAGFSLIYGAYKLHITQQDPYVEISRSRARAIYIAGP